MLPVDLTDQNVRIRLQQCDWQLVREARAAGKPWEALVTQDGFRALHWAVMKGDAPAVRRLLEQEAPVGSYRLGGVLQSPLWSAIQGRHDGVATLLLQAGADPGEVHPGHATELPLTGASKLRLTNTVLSLLDREPSLSRLPMDQQLRVVRCWVGGVGTPQPEGAQQVLQAIQASGWVPPFGDPAWGELMIQSAGVVAQATPDAGEFLRSWMAHWRQLALAQHPPSPRTQPRARS